MKGQRYTIVSFLIYASFSLNQRDPQELHTLFTIVPFKLLSYNERDIVDFYLNKNPQELPHYSL
jgi:hypothetical protein